MAQLKSGSTMDGIEIAKKDLSNVSSSLPSATKVALKGDNGANGANVSYSFSGNTLYITTG